MENGSAIADSQTRMTTQLTVKHIFSTVGIHIHIHRDNGVPDNG
jgi:hypothetical protein